MRGVLEATGRRWAVRRDGKVVILPVLRYRHPPAFVDRCATWDGDGIGPNGEPYPVAHKWDCRGCRWQPRRAVRYGALKSAGEAVFGPIDDAFVRLLLKGVDKPADNPGVIPRAPFWGDPPETLAHGQATGTALRDRQLEPQDFGVFVIDSEATDRIRAEHKPWCNTMFPSTLNTEDDHCDCGADT